MEEKQVLVRIEDLCKYFRLSSKEELKAVDHVSFDIFRNETVGIVGESGCGKTTLGRTVLGLYRAGSCLTGWTSTAPGNGKCANLKSAPRSCSRIPMHP